MLCLRSRKVGTLAGLEQVSRKGIGDKVRESWVPDCTDFCMHLKGIYFLFLVNQEATG